MLPWLTKLDPNVVAPIVVSVVLFQYHALFSKAAQAKVSSALANGVALAEKAVAYALRLMPAGTTAAQLENQLLAIAKAQLAQHGFDVSKLPPVVTALLQAIVDNAVNDWKASQAQAVAGAPAPQPQAVPIVAAPATAPVIPATVAALIGGTVANMPAKGIIRPQLALAIAGMLALGGIALEYGCGAAQKTAAKTCEASVLQKDLTVNGVATTLGDALENALSASTEPVPVALLTIASSLGMPLALDSLQCALDLIEFAPVATTARTGSASTTASAQTRAQRVGEARAWLNLQRKAVAARSGSGK